MAELAPTKRSKPPSVRRYIPGHGDPPQVVTDIPQEDDVVCGDCDWYFHDEGDHWCRNLSLVEEMISAVQGRKSVLKPELCDNKNWNLRCQLFEVQKTVKVAPVEEEPKEEPKKVPWWKFWGRE